MGIAVPIQDYTGNVVAGLSISGLELRMSKESDRLVWLCQQAAFEISKRMGSR
jgi:DNA-binding IclR family transcriptional regulator